LQRAKCLIASTRRMRFSLKRLDDTADRLGPFFRRHGQDFIMATRTRTTNSSFMRSGCFSTSLSTVFRRSESVMSLGGHASFIDRMDSKTPKTALTQTPAAAK
jgi:hypothetical protein